MSIELNQSNDDHFDDDEFIQETLNFSMNQNSSISEFKIPSPVSELINNEITTTATTTTVTLPKCRLDFNVSDTETPRNSLNVVRNRKRTNFSRRCLSTDLNSGDHYETDQMSFQEFRFSNQTSNDFKSPLILSSIENKISPRTTPKHFSHQQHITLELTPEFNNTKQLSSSLKPFDENDIIPKAKCMKSSLTNAVKCGGGGPSNVPLQKYFSENHASIMRAVQRSSDDSSLIGDFSRTYALPLMTNSKHQDLRSITCHVLAELMQNQRYSHQIRSFTIIDCRYPYEYDGGHIQMAINLYTQEQILNRFIKTKPKEAGSKDSSNDEDDDDDKTANDKRDILIFHCEFSSERGPSLCRFLRNNDRVKNSRVYPKLHYPEIYLLDGGYKEFFQHYSHLCEPCAYKPMHSKNHEEDLKKFRTICKSLDYKYSTRKRNLRL